MTDDEYDQLIERIEDGATITMDRAAEAIFWIRDVGTQRYRGMSAANWIDTVVDILTAAGMEF